MWKATVGLCCGISSRISFKYVHGISELHTCSSMKFCAYAKTKIFSTLKKKKKIISEKIKSMHKNIYLNEAEWKLTSDKAWDVEPVMQKPVIKIYFKLPKLVIQLNRSCKIFCYADKSLSLFLLHPLSYISLLLSVLCLWGFATCLERMLIR